jgi:hypothetical protein
MMGMLMLSVQVLHAAVVVSGMTILNRQEFRITSKIEAPRRNIPASSTLFIFCLNTNKVIPIDIRSSN